MQFKPSKQLALGYDCRSRYVACLLVTLSLFYRRSRRVVTLFHPNFPFIETGNYLSLFRARNETAVPSDIKIAREVRLRAHLTP